mgnify:CR=1 FL=1
MTKNNNMGNKISKTLDAVFARVTFDLTKADIRQSYKDRIALEILREDGTMAYRALVSKLKDWELFQAPLRIENLIKTQPRDEEVAPEEFLKQYRRKLLDENKTVRNVSTAHALLDITADTTTATSQILAQYGITAQTIASAMTELTDPLPDLQSEIRFHAVDLNDESSGKSSAMLDKFGSDLTRLAREGKIDPVIGREAEIDRVIQILSRRKKNNPILIGEAGVGKSAIIEGLALRIASGEVPYTIRNKTIFSLDVASLVAGTKFRGEFEERMQQLLDELRRSKDTIIFIDEIHTIVGAGATQGSLDTANILKPALARGELQTIGATTLDEFRENIESDSALERRFQKVMIDPTSAAQTLEILRNIAPYYEKHHNVRYSEDALKACVALTERYITDRHFPDKAIDVMDEAGARTRIGAAREPDAIRETERQLQAVEQERREAVTALIYEKAATARIKEVALKSRLNEQRAEWHRDMQSNPIEIGTAEVERVITSMTGIPAEHISHGEAERLRSLGEYLEGRVIGQSEAVQRVSRALQRSRAGLKDAGRPIGVFLFVGPTGVGKTLLAKELSKWLFDSKRGLIRIDMSEYGEKHNVARLIGSPPGYVGYGEGGQLTEAVRRQPYAVILFDEIEKAHPDVFNSMLQIFDEGHLTDGSGRKVDFRNTVIILTSNVGSRAVAEKSVQVGYNTPSKDTNCVVTPYVEYRKALEYTFAPEFLNRIDDIVYFRTLTVDDVEQIIDLELDGILSRTKQLGYEVEITSGAKQRLAVMGYESRYGVRALRRTLLDQVEEPLSALIIDGKLQVGGRVTIDRDEEENITLRVA